MDGDERKKRALASGREMLAKYKGQKAHNSSSNLETSELSDRESSRNDVEAQSAEHQGTSVNEGTTSRDVTQSSVSMSEEGDADLDGMVGRVAELEELLQGKEAVVEALNMEIDHLRGEASSPNSSQSRGSSIQCRDLIVTYQTKLQEFEREINKRNNFIEDLSSALDQAISSRGTILTQLMALREKTSYLETTVINQQSVAEQLNAQLALSHDQVKKLEIEKETQQAEMDDYKLRINQMSEQIRAGAAENNLNIVETLEQQKQYETRINKIKRDMQMILEKCTTEANANSVRHQKELKDLEERYESRLVDVRMQFEDQLKQAKEKNQSLTDRLNKELADLENRHSNELSVFQAQLANYKKTVEALKRELVNHSEAQRTAQAEVSLYKARAEELSVKANNERHMQELNHRKENEMLRGQIELHKLQLEEMTSKYMAATSVLESKESIERSLDQALTNATLLKQENDTLKSKLDDISAQYSAAQSLIDNSQMHERSLSHRIYDLEKSLSRLSGVSANTLGEFNETSYQTFDEVALQYQITRQKLEEKLEMEKHLVERIGGLEEEVHKVKTELERANLAKESYEKELKDMKNTCDKWKSEVNALKELNSNEPRPFQSSLYFGTDGSGKSQSEDAASAQSKPSAEATALKEQLKSSEKQIEDLMRDVQQRESENLEYAKKIREVTEKMRKSEEKCQNLMSGLATAWEQCAEFKEKLSQSQAMNESRLEDSSMMSTCSDFNVKSKDPPSVDESSKNLREESSIRSEHLEKRDSFDAKKMKHLQSSIDCLTEERERLLKEIEVLTEKQSNHDEVVQKLYDYQVELDNLQCEKERLAEDNRILTEKQECVDALEKQIARLNEDKESLEKQIGDMIEQHKEEARARKADAAVVEIQKSPLSTSVAEGVSDIEVLRVELEARHAKEMEELRTYFEQKCLQMEKQYSEEVFSQQSKKMSDNDSEIEELTEDLYYGGGAGDCLNVSESASRSDTPLPGKGQRNKTTIAEDIAKSHADDEMTLESVKSELQKKIREVEALKEFYEKKLEEQKNLFEAELQDVKNKTGRVSMLQAVHESCQTDWDPIALESGELTELRAVYSHQLEEQVALARLDIVNALQEQIQALLAANDADAEENWPSELLELRSKFTDNSKHEMQVLKDNHLAELSRLKEEHSRSLARTIERYQEEIAKLKSKKQAGGIGLLDESDLVRERNNLHKACVTLKRLVEELIKYFVMCEEEVNTTLISEVLKGQLSKSATEDPLESSQKEKQGDEDRSSRQLQTPIKRVHFAPQSKEIVSILNSDEDTLHNLVEEEQEFAQKLRTELSNCLDRLKSDSAQVLGVSLPQGDSELDTLSKQVLWTTKVNEELVAKLEEAETLLMDYQEESEQLKVKILDLQQKLINAESKKEVISEGYGEHEDSSAEVTIENLTQLQDRARSVLMNGGGENSYLLQLIEELCRHSDKITDDAKREKEDLQLQIEAADKQLRATRKFMEEQASEREGERDEAARQIQSLQEQLKDRERDKERDLRITSEPSLSPVPSSDTPELQRIDIIAAVEALESQMREMSSMMSDTEAKKSETEGELKAAVDKIWVLRDIITDLEQQVQAKTEAEEALQHKIEQLEDVITAQTKNQQELAQELDAVKFGSENGQLNEHIDHLQEELRKHKLSSEHFNVNSTALKQMKVELHDMQNLLDKRTKELEALHMCGSNLSLSQPSEDVSLREQIDASRCSTPDDPQAPPMLPLDQFLKLKDKLMKNTRAEEVAIKRIKDMDMQLTNLKSQNEELQAEQEILQQTISEQLFQIETMRGRLEQQKQSAPFAQRQATTRLELQLHEANTKFHTLERTLADKELEIKDVKNQLDRANQLLIEKETEISTVVQAENSAIQKLRDRIEVLEEERKNLESKVGVQERAQSELPQLIDSMLADKNEEIDLLKEQLSKKEKQLEVFLSLNLEESQLRELAKQAEPKNSARTLSDILSIHSECEDFPEAIREAPNLTQTLPHNMSNFKMLNAFNPSKDTFDASPLTLIDSNNTGVQVPRLELGSQSHSLSSPQHLQASPRPLPTCNETDLRMTSSEEDRVSSPDHNVRSEVSHEYESSERPAIEILELSASKSKEAVPVASESHQRGAKSLGSSEKHLEVSEKKLIKLQIQNLETQLNKVKEELNAKSLTLNEREAELSAIQKNFDELHSQMKETIDALTRDKFFYKNQYELTQTSEVKIKKDLAQVENSLKLKNDELREYKGKMQVNEKIIMELNKENSKLKQDLGDLEMTRSKEFEAAVREKIDELKKLKEVIFQKDVTIETIQTRNAEIEDENKQLYEYKTKYEKSTKEFAERQNEIQRLTEGLNNRDQLIRRLEEMAWRSNNSGASSPSDNKDQEIHHLQEYLKEKDKVIRQMSDDSKSLHRALETIQNKMKESGNVVELRKKLKDERKMNAELKEMVQKLRKELERMKNDSPHQSDEDADIEDMVQRELNLSAHLDRQIMDAIETEPEEDATRRAQRHSLDIEVATPNRSPEKSAQRSNEMRLKLRQATKLNEELNELKDDLEIEKELLKSQVAEYESRVLQIKSDLEEESRKVAQLDEDLSREKDIVRNLNTQLQKEQNAMHMMQMQDSELIACLRMKLEMSLEAEKKLRGDLTAMRQEHKNLEAQLSTIREEIKSHETDEVPGLIELLETEQKKYVALAEEYDKEHRKNLELQDLIKRTEAEKDRYEKELEVAAEEKERLVSSLTLAEGIQDHLSLDLKRTNKELKEREEECEWLQKRINTMSEAETKRLQHRTDEHNELKSLRREIANTREVMLDLEADMEQSKRELKKSLERQAQLARCVESLREKETELNKMLAVSRDEEKRLKEVIVDMQNDLQVSVRRELELTDELQRERLSSEKNAPVKFLQKIKELNESIEKYSRDNHVLHEKLAKARQDKEQFAERAKLFESQLTQQATGLRPGNKLSADTLEKIQHFYGKYLRVDSRRKALAYQKKYLLCIIGGYQLSEENTLSILAQLTRVQRSYTSIEPNRKSPRARFRSAALVIISIHRMKWMILRWRTGSRVGANVVLGNPEQSFMRIQRSLANHSPPVRDNPTTNREGGRGDFALDHYLQRLMNIQQTLGLAVDDPGTGHLISE